MFVQKNSFSNLNIDLVNASAPMGARDLAIFDDAKRTVPIGVEVLEECLNRSVIKLKDGNLDLIVMRLYVPKEREVSLQTWVSDFEERHGVKLIIQRQASYKGLQNLFNTVFKGENVLTASHIQQLDKILEKFFGTCPRVRDIDVRQKVLADLPDLSAIPLLAIDDADTKDPEDAFAVEKVADGVYRVTVAISDISWLIDPRGSQCRYAVNLGSTVYGSSNAISTLGKLSGEEVSHLSYEHLSPAWIIRFEIDGDRKIKTLREPFLANVAVHQHVTPQSIQNCEFAEPYLKDLMTAAVLLKIQRSGRKSKKAFIQDLQINPGLVTSEFMIRSKELFATFLQRYKHRDAIFKTQQNLSLNKIREFVRTLRKLGLTVRSDTFRNPILLSDFLTELQKNNFEMRIKTGHPNPEIEQINNEILNALLKRSHYDFHNRGHADLHLQSYCDIKGRLAAGIINQIQARSIYYAQPKPFNCQEIKKFTSEINRQMRNYGIKVYTFRFIEMLKDKLSHVGESFDGEIIKTHGKFAFIDVAGFKKWGICELPQGADVGSTVHLNLQGFSLSQQRFLFK